MIMFKKKSLEDGQKYPSLFRGISNPSIKIRSDIRALFMQKIFVYAHKDIVFDPEDKGI